jgi:ACS family hexuronate transporter-like MFS transporter
MAFEDQRPLSPLQPSAAQGWAIAIVATLVMAVSYVDRQTFAALSPTVCDALHIDHTQYGWLTSAFSLTYLVGAPLSGWIIDRSGARMGLVASVLVWSAISAMHAFAPSFALLFGLRIALGAAESPSFPGAAQAVQRCLPPKHRSAGFGLLFTGSSIGAMIAAPLAIAFNRTWGWRFAFLGTALVGLSWVPAWLAITHGGAARALLAAKPQPPHTRVNERAGYREAARVYGPSSPGPQSLLGLLALPVVQRAVILVVATAPAINFVFNWLPKYLVAERGLTQNGLAAYLWLPPLFFDAGAIAFGVIASVAGGVRRPFIALAGLLCASIALMPFAPGPVAAVGIASLTLLGGGAAFALLTSDMLSRVDARHVSSAGGLTAAAQSLAYVVANLLLGVVLDRTHSYEGVIVALGVTVVPGTAAWILWPGASREGTERTVE